MPENATAKCPACEILYINGHRCHEQGCPDAWRDSVRECRWCGSEFSPEERNQQFCREGCACDYNGIPDPDDEAPQEETE